MTHAAQHEDEMTWRMEGTAGEIADVLMTFAQEMRRGDINVWKGKRELHLDPTGQLTFIVDAIADEDGREGLHMKLHWMAQSPDRNALSGGAAPSGEPSRPS